MSDFNQPTRRQDKQAPSDGPDSQQQTRQTQHGSIERNPDAVRDRQTRDTDDSENDPAGDPNQPDSSR
jgi:hypothetical protein